MRLTRRGVQPLMMLDRWIFAAEPAGRIRLVRAGLGVFLAWRLGMDRFVDLAGQPAVLFQPPATFAWLDAMPPAGVLLGIQVVGVVAALTVIAGVRSRLPMVVAWVALVVLTGLLSSRGKDIHNDSLLIFACVPFLLARVPRRGLAGPVPGWPLRTAWLAVGLAYTIGGIQKVRVSGWDWVASDNLRNVLYNAAGRSSPPTSGPAVFVADRPLLASAVAFGALALELTFVAGVLSRRLRPLYALGAAALHVGIWLTLGLDYWSWVAVVLLLFVDWPTLLARPSAGRPPVQHDVAADGGSGPQQGLEHEGLAEVVQDRRRPEHART